MTESREELAAKIAKLEAGNKWAGEILEKRIRSLESEIDSLRHFIEDRIMDDKGWRIEYEAFLDELKEGEI